MCPVSSTLPSQHLPRRRLRPLILGATVLALFTLLAAPSAPAGRAKMDDGVASFHPACLPDGTHWTIHSVDPGFKGWPRVEGLGS